MLSSIERRAEEADHRYRRLLCARCKRPSHRAADHHDELAAPHVQAQVREKHHSGEDYHSGNRRARLSMGSADVRVSETVMSTCSSYLIRIPGYRLNKVGELVPDLRRLSVSERLRRANSKTNDCTTFKFALECRSLRNKPRCR